MCNTLLGKVQNQLTALGTADGQGLTAKVLIRSAACWAGMSNAHKHTFMPYPERNCNQVLPKNSMTHNAALANAAGEEQQAVLLAV